ncbi:MULTISPECIES: helix-turn-helix transcriptional regulator [Aeromonas]|uniref:helix-turn-helix transcriptional regulator n=1 Tax=Aeromonas TaxID=642 RepID=UPI0022E209BD|nr:helix-turn-helix transcriptional regulator [Aeromonas sp. D3]
MNVKQVAEYLDLNEKKVYQLANEARIPATKATGKWLFPRSLLDRWLLGSCHEGVMNDRLLLAGSDDVLLHYGCSTLARQLGTQALVGYTPCGTRQGLAMLARGHVDLCAIHWGQAEEAHLRHPALVQQYQGHRQWVIVHGFRRVQGLVLRQGLQPKEAKEALDWRWAMRQEGAGSQRALQEWLQTQGESLTRLERTLEVNSERELAAAISRGDADVGPGAQSTATEFGLGFMPLSQECFDLVMPQGVFFRTLLQQLISWLQSPEGRELAARLGGYDLTQSGKLVWSPQ